MYILPNWVFWFFLVAGFLSIGYSFIPRRNRSATGAFVLGLIGIGIALFLWFSPIITLK